MISGRVESDLSIRKTGAHHQRIGITLDPAEIVDPVPHRAAADGDLVGDLVRDRGFERVHLEIVIPAGVMRGGVVGSVFVHEAEWRIHPDAQAKHVLEELAGVLERSKFRQRLIVTNLSAVAAYRQVVSVTQRVTAPPLASIAELRDPADAIILACAVAAGADAIVTGDQDLLVLGSFRRIPILTATQTVEKLKLR